jgi:chromosome segregation ATPase
MTEETPAVQGTGTVGELLTTTQQLSELLADETERVRAGDRPGLEALQADKARLTERYERLVEQLNADPDQLDDVDNATHQALSQATQHFHETLEENRHALHVGMYTAETVVKAGVDAVNQASRSHAAYSPLGTTRRPGGSASPSLALNQRL